MKGVILVGLVGPSILAKASSNDELLFGYWLSEHSKGNNKEKRIALEKMLKVATYFSQYMIIHDMTKQGSDTRNKAFIRMFKSALGFSQWECVHKRATNDRDKLAALQNMAESANCFSQRRIILDHYVLDFDSDFEKIFSNDFLEHCLAAHSL